MYGPNQIIHIQKLRLRSGAPSHTSRVSFFSLLIPLPHRPPPMPFYHRIYFAHYHYRLIQRHHDLLIMLYLLFGQLSPFTIFQPLLADLITAYMGVIDLLGYPLEIKIHPCTGKFHQILPAPIIMRRAFNHDPEDPLSEYYPGHVGDVTGYGIPRVSGNR